MSRRIDIELTSSRDDGTWTWRAPGARQPKGTVDSTLVPSDAKVGDVLRADADFDLEGIVVTAVLAAQAPTPARAAPIASRSSDRVATARQGAFRSCWRRVVDAASMTAPTVAADAAAVAGADAPARRAANAPAGHPRAQRARWRRTWRAGVAERGGRTAGERGERGVAERGGRTAGERGERGAATARWDERAAPSAPNAVRETVPGDPAGDPAGARSTIAADPVGAPSAPTAPGVCRRCPLTATRRSAELRPEQLPVAEQLLRGRHPRRAQRHRGAEHPGPGRGPRRGVARAAAHHGRGAAARA